MIGGARYFASRMWAPRYWPKVGDVIAAVVQTFQGLLDHHVIRRRRRNAF